VNRSFTLFVLIVLVSVPQSVLAQSLTDGLLQNGLLSQSSLQLILLITVLSLAPGILIMITCFPFMINVLSILHQGIGLQQSPPNMMIVSLVLFLTLFVLEPVFTVAWTKGIAPYGDGAIDFETAFGETMNPFREFMQQRVNPDTLAALADLRPELSSAEPGSTQQLSLLVPSFMLSEIARAFQVGFLLFLPFLIIDLVVAAILMSMGMMMVPPAIVSLPFKLAFFVVADGWTLIASGLVQSYF
jgi:flagellar biosynthetic protein FliP